MSDHKGARFILRRPPKGPQTWIADRGYDSNWFRTALIGKGHQALYSANPRSRKAPIPYDKALYRQRHRIENMFGRLKDWAPHCHPLRSLRTHILLGHLHRRSRHILALMNEF